MIGLGWPATSPEISYQMRERSARKSGRAARCNPINQPTCASDGAYSRERSQACFRSTTGGGRAKPDVAPRGGGPQAVPAQLLNLVIAW